MIFKKNPQKTAPFIAIQRLFRQEFEKNQKEKGRL
jgi:stalled ribosome alternative rescue factor ArfA